MGAKRALIVDDSKSARLFLARILEKYEIDVDNAETAEAAIEYLAQHRPDVIFMDHLMPGMDGFQAVQTIKNNPHTATIPILMYTSQEGELYLGQARALGAVGVLPKQIRPADVSKVLYQLHLLADRRSPHQTSFRPLGVSSGPQASLDEHGAAGEAALAPKALTESGLREQFAELRRALVAGVDTQTERITAEVRALLLEALPPAPASVSVSAPEPPLHRARDWGWIVACVALLVALLGTASWWREAGQIRALREEVALLRQDLRVGAASSRPAVSAAAAAAAGKRSAGGAAANGSAGPGGASLAGAGPAQITGAGPRAVPTTARPMTVAVPYGADALAGPRLETIRQLLDRFVHENRSGVVDVKAYAGRFCLVGNASDGYSLAPDESAFSKCDLIGNPADDSLSPAQRTPLPFANLMGAVRNSSRGTLEVQSTQGDPATTVAPYPQITPELTAGEWNRAASLNNRVEIALR